MAPKVRDRIVNAFIMVAAGIAVSAFSVNYANNKSEPIVENNKIKQDIKDLKSEKLNKVEYNSDQEQKWKAHDQVHVLWYDMIKETNEKVNWLYQNEIKK